MSGTASARSISVPAMKTPQEIHDDLAEFCRFTYPQEPGFIRVTVEPHLLNVAGMLSGVVSYAMVDYAMGTALWQQVTEEEAIATLNISVNYLATVTEGDIVCRGQVDRRNRRVGVTRATVESEAGVLLMTAIGSYSIFPRKA